jgi:hypothetical protein
MEPQPPKRPPPSLLKLILWFLLWLVMWFWAIIGPVCVVLAVISFFVDLSPWVHISLIGGEPVRTTEQKILFLALGAVLSFLGLGYLWLRHRGYFKNPV